MYLNCGCNIKFILKKMKTVVLCANFDYYVVIKSRIDQKLHSYRDIVFSGRKSRFVGKKKTPPLRLIRQAQKKLMFIVI